MGKQILYWRCKNFTNEPKISSAKPKNVLEFPKFYIFSAIHCSNSAKILKACRPNLEVDPILWIPMTKKECSRCIRWRIGWLPGGKPKTCITCKCSTLTKKHAITCLRLHNRFSFSLNKFPKIQTSIPLQNIIATIQMAQTLSTTSRVGLPSTSNIIDATIPQSRTWKGTTITMD
ncbi:hypothetical protein BDA99DRAFT_153403 [Phascolomyces articulosus]|uniref:Uncharacterized protein n=1 Tax=Phascolomyces articulosus TaxID=60185 RepID=A0AAD5K582_9FUNG|nr:hypothetical protein BDA99DRAFT_153403 [Phascolomyces articulosus]